MGAHIWVHIYERPYMNINERKIRCTNFGSRHRTFLAPGCQTAEVRYTVTPCLQHHQIGYKTQKQLTSIYRCAHIWTPIYGHPHMWTPIYGHPYMVTHIWLHIYGCTYMNIHTTHYLAIGVNVLRFSLSSCSCWYAIRTSIAAKYSKDVHSSSRVHSSTL